MANPVRKVVNFQMEEWKALNAPYIRAGKALLYCKGNGKKFKPTAQVIFNRAYTRLAERDNVNEIVRDLHSQIKLLERG